MYCDRCGANLGSASAYCSNCGKAFHNVPPLPAQGRVAGNLRLLAIFWIALSALRLVPGIIVMLIGGAAMRFLPPEVPPFVHTVIPIVGGFLLAFGAAGIVAGWGLLTRQSWARMLAIVLGFLNLIHVPFGTALGVYTLWVLLPAQSEQEYRSTAQTA